MDKTVHHVGTISLCMIVRDEEHDLGRCLESARGFVDEIVVVDTGSRDATPAVAGRYGARIFHLPWQDDFSQARNESLKQAIGEWVLILDADEELPPETARILKRLASCSDVAGWIFTIISSGRPGRAGRMRHPALRMFQNRDGHFFEGRVHEQVRPSIVRADPGAVILHAEAAIMHYGYSQGVERRREKTLRNISILKQALAEQPDDPWQHYHLGLSFYALGDLENSRRHYEAARKFLDTAGAPSEGQAQHPGYPAAAFFRNYAICLSDLGDYEQALRLADEGLAHFPDYPDLYFIKGQLYCDLNLMAQARANFLKCLRFRQTLPEYVTTEGVTGHLALNNLAEVCAREQNFDEAVSFLEQALRRRPSFALFVFLCSLLQQKGLHGAKVAAYLEEGFGLDHPTIARLLFGMKQERVLRLVLEALVAGDRDPYPAAAGSGGAPCPPEQWGREARQALGNYALRAGYSRESLLDVESALHGGIATAGVNYLLGTACASLDRHDRAFLHFVQAGMQDPGNELYAACALEQLAGQCLRHITGLLALEDRAELRQELFRLTSLKHKAQRLKQDLLASGVGCRKSDAGTFYCPNQEELPAPMRNSLFDIQPGCDTGATVCHDDSLQRWEATGEQQSPDAASGAGTGAGYTMPDAGTFSVFNSDFQPPASDILISIVMPVWTGQEVTHKALQAISAWTDCPYEIIVIDNGSDAGCRAVIADFENRHRESVRVIRNESNRGYPAACNQGLGVSRGKYAVVMNNDVLVTPHWASRMIAAFSDDGRVGAVGPVTNHVFGEQLVRGCDYEEATLNEWSQRWYDRHAGSRRSTLRLVGFLMMIRRELIEQIGGFDPIFGPGNYDDDDYCLRARLAGYRLLIADDVFVHHYGSMSFNKKPEAFARLLEVNRRLFAAKWGLDLQGSPEQAVSLDGDQKKLYVPLGN
jgi:GT2 family glycosyltransferase/tetratricopeptide (TPR) repeat protein